MRPSRAYDCIADRLVERTPGFITRADRLPDTPRDRLTKEVGPGLHPRTPWLSWNPTMSTNSTDGQEGIDRESDDRILEWLRSDPLSDELAGLYPANKTAGTGGYPPVTDKVLVSPPGPDGYHDVTLIDVNGDIVAVNNRARFRIEGALEGEYGYDIVVAGVR